MIKGSFEGDGYKKGNDDTGYVTHSVLAQTLATPAMAGELKDLSIIWEGMGPVTTPSAEPLGECMKSLQRLPGSCPTPEQACEIAETQKEAMLQGPEQSNDVQIREAKLLADLQKICNSK
jgi:hypothetical protein